MSQPALSYQIKSLENELCVKLFERTTTSVQITEAGIAFSEPAEEFHCQYLRTFGAVRRYSSPKKHIVLAFPYALVMRDKIYRVLMDYIVEAFPQYEVEIRINKENIDIRASLLGGIDCIVGIKPSIEDETVRYYPLFQPRCYLAVPPQHALAGHGTITPQMLDRQTLYCESGGREYTRMICNMIEQDGVAVTLKEVDTYGSAYPALVAGKGLFIGHMPYDVLPQEWYVPLRVEGLPPVVLMCLRKPASSHIHLLAQLIQRVYQEASTE